MTPQRRTGAHDLPRGTTLGKYEILRKIAVGGMAEIYLARARGTAGFEKIVVLKRILPNIAEDPTFVQMFLDEARLAATLQHPHIADVHDVGDIDGELFFAMEFIHGQDVRAIRLEARARKEAIPLSIALSIVHGTASALDYAHEKQGPDGRLLGLVHRDVSSSNVIVSYDGAIKLLDFGIARAQSHQHKTQVGTLKGKIPYMSPEQCRGHTVDRRSDLFSLGVVMFELTVGRRPFRGEGDFAIMDAIVNHPAPTPSSMVEGYPPELEAMVMKLLARKPEDRYQSADHVVQELEAFVAQHQHWVSSKTLGKYMRTVFADKIAAWETAQQDGVSLSQHVAATITSESQRSELVTPPSAFPGLRPLSQEMPAVGSAQLDTVEPPVSAQIAAVEPAVPLRLPLAAPPVTGPVRTVPAPVATAVALPSSTQVAVPAAEPTGTVYPSLRPSRTKWLIAAIAAVAVGGIAGLMMYGGGSKKAARPPAANSIEATTAKQPATDVPAPVPVEAKPAVAAPKTTPTVEAPKSKPTVEAPKPAPTVEVAKPTSNVTHPPTVTKPKTKPKPKEVEWDPNSPFLPPN